MITRDEITRSLTGAWELFLDRPNAVGRFDTGYDGFWRSFQAIVLIVPFYAITVLAAWRSISIVVPEAALYEASTFYWARAVALVVDWVTLPILLAAMAGILDIKGTYAPYVVVRNWSTVLIVMPYAVIAALETAFGLSASLVIPLSLVAMAAVLRLSYLAARRAMQANIGLAIGIVVLDFFLSLFLSSGVNLLFGLPATF